MARIPEWPTPWGDEAMRPTPASAPWPDAYVAEKDPPPVLYGPKGQPLAPTRAPERFGFQPRRGMRP